MKAYKPLIIAFLLAGNAITASSQSLEPFNPYGMINPSVQSFKMARYGQESPSLYNGSMNCSIPVYTYSDPDFSIPIRLDYHFDGFRPSEDSGLVGYGWILNCGGVITREVRGLPDDYLPKTQDFKKGFILLPKNRSYRITSQTNLVLTPNTKISQLICERLSPFKLRPFFNLYAQEDMCLYDTESDIYHYSFPGHQGSFFINEDGDIIVSERNTPGNNLSISMTSPYYDMDGIASVDFQIKTSEGYEFIFKPLEICASVNEHDLLDDLDFKETPKSYTGYRLVQIIAPNGRIANIQYRPGSLQTSFLIDKHYYTITNNEYDESSPSQNAYTLSGTAIPESIKVDGNIVVSFDYENHNTPGEWEDNCFCSISDCSSRLKSQFPELNTMEKIIQFVNYGKRAEHLRLSGIFAFNSNRDKVSSTTFNYQYTSGTPKMLLFSVNTDSGIYKFQYQTDISLPANDTHSTDYWGYWNAWPSDRQTNLDFAVNNNNLHTGDRYNQFFTEYAEWKLPSFSKAIACALTKITFPTGGWTTIEYEGNLVGKRINGLVPSLENCQNYPVGGVRVRNISNYSANGDMLDYQLYRYSLKEGGSSGILQTMPIYAAETFHAYKNPENDFILLNNASLLDWVYVHTIAYINSCNAARARDGHIGYSSVSVEHIDGSTEEYKFSSYTEYPDTYDDFEIHSTKLTPDADMYKNVLTYQDRIVHASDGDYYFLIPPQDNMYAVPIICPPSTDKSGSRGKLKEKITYDIGGNIIRHETYTYNIANDFVGYPIHDFVYEYKKCAVSLRWSYLKSRTEIEYNSGKDLRKQWEYSYNHDGQIISEDITASSDIVTTYYYYINEITPKNGVKSAAAIGWGYDKQLSYAIKTRIIDGEKYIIAAEHYDYAGPAARHLHPTAITSYIIEKPILVKAGMMGRKDMISLLSSCGTMITRFEYNNKGRLIRLESPGGAYIAYTWTSDGKYIASKSVNADDNMLKYEWRDMIGLSKVQDVTGQTETYLYDSRNRLMQRTDTNGNPTEKYYYHLINE